MGTGKSTVARALADKMNRIFIDMDILIEEKEGKSIADIFNQKGEVYFRKIEKTILSEITKRERLVIATGGGTLLDEHNYQLVHKNSIVILLQANPEIIYNRLKTEDSRPLLSGENKFYRIINLMNQREAKYSRFEHCIDTSNLTVTQVVNKITKICQKGYDEKNITEI